MKKCAYCGRDNAADVAQCRECGTPFATAEDTAARPRRTAAEQRMLNGALLCGGGIFVTLITYAAAANGGTYVVAWGAIVFGGLQFFQGLRGRGAQVRFAGYAALAYGTKLERQGRVEEALAAYKDIMDKYPGTEVAKDAKKSLDSLQGKLG